MQSEFKNVFSLYWWAYGGWRALIGSGYLWASVVFTLISFNIWTNPGWWDISIGALPTVLGFTVAGFAVFIGFGDDAFRSKLAEVDDDSNDPGEYIQFCSSFVHFILVQVSALMFALLGKSYSYHSDLLDQIRIYLPWFNKIFGFIGYGLFVYAIATIVAVAMHFLNLADIYRAYKKFEIEINK